MKFTTNISLQSQLRAKFLQLLPLNVISDWYLKIVYLCTINDDKRRA